MFRPSARPAFLAAALFLGACGAPEVPEREEPSVVAWHVGPPLPSPVASNVVVALELEGDIAVFSFLGTDSLRRGATNAAYRWDLEDERGWREISPVPGRGRIGATGQVVGGRVYLFGGSTVGADGTAQAVGDVSVYDPVADRWTRAAGMPVPVADAVSGVWRDSLVVVVSGARGGDGVGDVQWYDPATDRWSRGTPIAGPPVAGHAGSVVGDQIIYIDGVGRAGRGSERGMLEEPWIGEVDPSDPAEIVWTSPGPHPAPALQGAAAGTVGRVVLFVGGTDRPRADGPEDPDGVRPVRQVLAYAPGAGTWRYLAAPPLATMDHRTLGVAGGMVFLAGGVEEGGRVSSKVWVTDTQTLLATMW